MSRAFKIILSIIGIVILVVIIGVGLLIFLLSNGIHHLDSKYTRLKQDYQEIKLPADLSYISSNQTGDPIDSPDAEGWQYKYKTFIAIDQMRSELTSALRAAGYSPGAIGQQSQDGSTVSATLPLENNGAYDFEANNSTKGTQVEVHLASPEVQLFIMDLKHE